jgi:sodium/hydrogen antiporter
VEGLTILAVVFAVYAMLAGRLDRWSVTAPMVFVLTGALLGPDGTGALPISLSSEATLTITELTLALVLFADASSVRGRALEVDVSLPTRLLFIGLPLTVVLGTFFAELINPSSGWAAAALIATILAPTDAALGLAVVTNRAVPARIRRALNVESGLNDGLATPFVTLFLAVLVAEEASSTEGWAQEAVTEIGLAIVAAVVVGLAGGWLLRIAKRYGWTSTLSEQLAVVSLALLSYAGAVWIGGNGFVAAFLGGILFGSATKGELRESVEYTENTGLFTSFLVWTLFGALFVGHVLTHAVSWSAVLYAVLSLTIVRIVPVWISLAGVGFRRRTVLFMGWFGPRGLASVVFTLIAIEELEAGGTSIGSLEEIATWTILLSVLLHGVTARPWARSYGKAISLQIGAPELDDVEDLHVRHRALVGHHPVDPMV